jgi:hypothetical protein
MGLRSASRSARFGLGVALAAPSTMASAEALARMTVAPAHSCGVIKGMRTNSCDERVFHDASELDIDHVVPLAELFTRHS